MPKDETFRHITCQSVTVKNGKNDSINLAFDDGVPKINLSLANGTRAYFTVDKEGRIIYGYEGGKQDYRLHYTPEFVIL